MRPAHLMETYLIDVVQRGRLDLIESLAQPDMVDEANMAFGGPPGRDGLTAHVFGFRKNIGALALSIDRIVDGDQAVMAQWSFSGTHDGPWLGIPASGERIQGTVFSFFELKEARISRYRLWLHADLGGDSIVFDSSHPEAYSDASRQS